MIHREASRVIGGGSEIEDDGSLPLPFGIERGEETGEGRTARREHIGGVMRTARRRCDGRLRSSLVHRVPISRAHVEEQPDRARYDPGS